MKSLSIKAKIIVVSAIAVCVIAFVALENYFTMKPMAGLATQTQTAGLLLRQHLDGDMMHDAIPFRRSERVIDTRAIANW